MTFLDRPRFRAVYLPFVIFTVFAGDFWRYTISWFGFGALAFALFAIAIVMLVRSYRRKEFVWHSFPFFLALFLALAVLSITWSFYRGATALGLLATGMTVVLAASVSVQFGWTEILRALGLAMRWILGLSLIFEFVVSAFIRHPVLPFWVSYDETGKLPKLLYWSRDLLFDGGKIQGIVGNSSLLAFVALVGLIVFSVQFAERSVNRIVAGFWIAVAVGGILLTRSATITVAIAVLAVLVLVVLALRRSGPRLAAAIYAVSLAAIIGGIVVITQFSSTILGLLGKSSDLTGRLDIWSAVISLAQERPAFGWGWVSWWVPWVAPFDNLAFEAGVRQLHAHNAWLDVFLQLGIAGLVVFGLLVFSTGIRSWLFATESQKVSPRVPGTYSALTLLPLLLLVALLVQSAAESRLLIEYGLFLLTVIAIKTKLGDRPTREPAAQ